MRYRVSVKRLMDGQYYGRCETGPQGLVERTGSSKDEVLTRIRREIEYQLDWCPCTGAAREDVELDVNGG